jgi:hypothetical protein
MKTNYLFSSNFKKIGWFLFVTGIILGLIYFIYQSEPTFLNVNVLTIAEQSLFSKTSFFSITKTNLFDEIIGLFLIIGSIFIAFSKEKSEDEFISKIRLESLVWATYINYAILMIISHQMYRVYHSHMYRVYHSQMYQSYHPQMCHI